MDAPDVERLETALRMSVDQICHGRGTPADFNDILEAVSITRIHSEKIEDDQTRDATFAVAFQSTRPHGARPARRMQFGLQTQFQSTRPHGARLQPIARPPIPGCVSIHAPARGATGCNLFGVILLVLFQSTRPHGARPMQWAAHRGEPPGFNPRARTGRDPTSSAMA